MKLGIAVLSENNIIEKLVRVQSEINKIDSLSPVLSVDGNLPHVTLLQGRFRSFEKINNALYKLHGFLASINSPAFLNVSRVEYVEAGWYFIEFHRSDWIDRLHSFAFELLRGEMYLSNEDKLNDISGYSNNEKSNYLNYGYRYIGACYSPHITIGRTRLRRRSEHEKDIIKRVSHNITGEIPINRITLYRVGENGSHAETLNCLEHSAYRANRGANTGHGFC